MNIQLMQVKKFDSFALEMSDFPALSNQSAIQRDSSGDRALAIIDSRIDNIEFLIAETKPGTEILVLHPHSDGVSQIDAALKSHSNISSLHLIAHGSPGCLYLGNIQLSSDTLTKYSSKLKLWSETLNNKDVLIYGCEVAQGQIGKSFLQQLHQLTGANLAASVAKVGYIAETINWELSTCIGKITTDIVFSSYLQTNYRGHFAEVSFNVEPDVGIETEGTEVTFNFALDEAPPPEGTVVVLNASEPSSINRFIIGGFGEALEFTGIDGTNENPLFFDVSPNLDFSSLAVNIREQNASITGTLFNSQTDQSLDGSSNPDIEDAADVAESITYSISEIAPSDVPASLGTPGTIAAGASSDTIIFADNPEQLDSGSGTPEISISSDITTLVEDEGSEVTFTFSLSEAPPEGGIVVPIETGKAFALGDFDVFPPPPSAIATGGALVAGFADNSGFDFRIDEQTATVSLPIFDDSDSTENGAVTDPDGPLRNDDIGEEQTTFFIGEGEGYTVSADAGSVTLTLIDTNQPDNGVPVADDDSYTTSFGAELTINAANGVLDGDTDVDGDSLTAALIDEPTNGSLTLNDDGSFSYTPDAGFSGTDSFTYSANDGQADSNPATVEITVQEEEIVNTAPVAESDSYTTAFGEELAIDAAAGVLDNDTDADGDSLSAALIDQSSNGSLTFNDDGSFFYTPDAGFSGTDSFTYIANDGQADSSATTVEIIVQDEVSSLEIIGTEGDDTLTGTSDDNTIRGENGEDLLEGLDGNDTLIGGSGNDTLIGGTGEDQFVLNIGEGTDIIEDYELFVDKLVLGSTVPFEDLGITRSNDTLEVKYLPNDEVLAIANLVDSQFVSSQCFY